MKLNINTILDIQRHAWSKGHDNYGSTIDVIAAILNYLNYFKHLNPAQYKLKEELSKNEDIKFAKKLCSRANKAARHYVVSLK